jgi:hypothetical protein
VAADRLMGAVCVWGGSTHGSMRGMHTRTTEREQTLGNMLSALAGSLQSEPPSLAPSR